MYLFSQHFFPIPDNYIENMLALKPGGPGSFVLLFVGICVIVPFAEEILFRGIFQQVFNRNMGPVLALLLTGLFFGVAHFSTHLLLSVTLFGIFLSYIFYATGSVTYPIIAHGLFNTVSFFQLLLLEEERLAEPPFYTRHPWMFVASLIIVVWLCAGIKKGSFRSGSPLK
jgi:membrane protease YdiL (CAAX protease family)